MKAGKLAQETSGPKDLTVRFSSNRGRIRSSSLERLARWGFLGMLRLTKSSILNIEAVKSQVSFWRMAGTGAEAGTYRTLGFSDAPKEPRVGNTRQKKSRTCA